MNWKTLLYEVDKDGILLVTINRPDKLNALNGEVLTELDKAFDEVYTDESIKAVVLTGAGTKSFVAGADIRQFTELGALTAHRFALFGQAVFNKIEGSSKPVIAAINGYALGGGCELALACHLRMASEQAALGQPEVNLGIIPGYGGTQRLPRIVGKGVATELILTGEHISAQRAYEIGLVNRVVAQEEIVEKSKELAFSISQKAPVAIKLALDALRVSDLPIQEGLRYEAALFGHACVTEDFKEGVDAFLNRRKANFKGK